jgi:hypothetical protein
MFKFLMTKSGRGMAARPLMPESVGDPVVAGTKSVASEVTSVSGACCCCILDLIGPRRGFFIASRSEVAFAAYKSL